MKKNIILFPGNFSPIDIAHLMMALSAFNILNARKVIFLPFGQTSDQVSVDDRSKMIELSIEDYGLEKENFTVSKYFSTNEKMVDMVSHFKLRYPDDRLILLLGEDELSSFYALNGIDKITYLSQVYYVPRDESFDKELEKKYVIHSLPIYKMPIQASAIRNGTHLYTTKRVLSYIGLHKLYFCKEIASMMKESRYLHSLSVAKTAFEIARHNPGLELDPTVAFQAGIFHDCGKDIAVDDQRKIVEEHFPSYLPCPDFALHQFVGSHLAKEKFHIDNEEVLSSIMYHCTGKGDMSALEKLIYSADKVEPTRQFKTRRCRLACYENLEKGFVLTLKDQMRYFEEKNIPFMEHFLSKEMYSKYIFKE